MYAEPSGSNQCAEPSGSNLYVINWQSEGVAPQYYQTLFIPLACNRGSLSCVCSIGLGVKWHLKDSLNAVNKHVMDCLMGHSPPVGSILVGKCDASA